ncbi:MAG: amidohydrolase, partial [Bacteroidota bacterium]
MRFISASQIFSGKEFLKEDTVLVLKEDGTITDLIAAESIDNTKIEHYHGILTPGFINTHCHLELSHLKDKINRHTGIVDFGLSVIKHRNDIAAEQQQEYMLQADKDMKAAGIVAVGDISNSALSAGTKKQSKLYYHTFVELIALNPERANLVFDAGLE